MDIEKDSDREAFEAWLKSLNENGRTTYFLGQELTVAWKAWQAAKAQAVPSGFVLVSQKDLLDLTVAINAVDLATHTESKTNEVREMWRQIAIKLMMMGVVDD